MSMNPTSIIFALIRATLIVVGLAFFVLSFFHGADINLGVLVGLSMVAISLSPYETSSSKTKIWGILVSITSFILYSYLLKTLLQGQLSSNESNAINFLILSFYLLPLVCLAYLIAHFFNSLRQGAAK